MVGYGNAVVRGITISSYDFHQNPPEGFSESPILKPLGAMYIAKNNQRPQLEKKYQQVSKVLDNVELVDSTFVYKRVPQLRENHVDAGFWEPNSKEIDVAVLLQGYMKGAKHQGTRFIFNARVEKIERKSAWQLTTDKGDFSALNIVNAAGAWADKVAHMAGAKAVGLVPKRRTVCVAKPPKDVAVTDWPLTIDIDETFYFKPECGNILITPADETPMEPQDVYPEDMDVATGIERFQKAMNIEIKTVVRKWAGLRSFVPDKSPVVGFDTNIDGFFWLAGQGGYGIQMAPALAKIAASLAMENTIPEQFTRLGVNEALISPKRYQV